MFFSRRRMQPAYKDEYMYTTFLRLASLIVDVCHAFPANLSIYSHTIADLVL